MIQQAVLNGRNSRQERRGTLGFTLVEVIVAIGVLSVAITIFAGLFGGSTELAKLAQQRTVAAGLADEQLSAILRDPAQFQWAVNSANGEGLFAIRQGDEDPAAGNPFETLQNTFKGLSPLKATAEKQDILYDKFRWQAFGKQAQNKTGDELPYYEVTVVIRWKANGKAQLLALTSSVPLGAVPPSADAPLQGEVKT